MFEIGILEIRCEIGILAPGTWDLTLLKLGFWDFAPFEIGILGFISFSNWDFGIPGPSLTGPSLLSIYVNQSTAVYISDIEG